MAADGTSPAPIRYVCSRRGQLTTTLRKNKMDKAEIQTRRNGTGYLVLRSGVSKQVTWEIEVLNDGSGGKGIVRGDKDHLAAAAKDGCANLLASADTTVAVAIDGCENGEASFSLLLVSSAPRTFRAETIENSGPIVDGNRFLIEFSGSDDERLFVIVPTIIMRDYLITLEKVVPPSSISLIRSSEIVGNGNWRDDTIRVFDL